MKCFWICSWLLLTGPGLALAQADQRGALITENVPLPDARTRKAIKGYHDIAQYGFHGWLGHSMLVSARPGKTVQAFRLKRPGAHDLQRLSPFDGPVHGLVAAPDGHHVILSHDQNGDEQYQGVLLDLAANKSLPFTGPGFRHSRFVFSRDTKWIAWQRAAKNSPKHEIMLAPLAHPAARKRIIFQGGGVFLPLDFSPDNKTLLVNHYISVSESRLFLLDIGTGSLKPLNPHPWPIAYGRGQFSHDGKAVIAQSDAGRAFVGLLRIDLQSGALKALSPDLKGDVTGFAVSADGRTLGYSVNMNGASRVLVASALTGRLLASPKLPAGVVTGLAFSREGGHLGFTLDGASRPAGAWAYEWRSGQVHEWTTGLSPKTDPSHFRRPRRFEYASFAETDGRRRKIPAYLYMPPKSARRPVPVIVFIHGGPEAQYRPRFSPQIQTWLNHLGVAVIAPNIRGSSGYGGQYVALDDGVHRQDAIRDIGALLDWIARRKTLDASKIILYGGSYGGYVVLAAMARYPQRLAGGMDLFGISDFTNFLENTSEYRQNLRRTEYGDERQPVMQNFFSTISPLSRAKAIRAPLFIVHGQNDPRVPVAQSLAMRDAVRAAGLAPVWYMLAGDEGHGFKHRENVLALRAAEIDFVRYCLAQPQSGTQ